MYPEEIHSRQRRLTEYIEDLAKAPIEERDLDTWVNKFEVIYEDDFRHNYSDFFPILLQVFDEKTDSNSEFLSNNIEMIRNKMEDHINEGAGNKRSLYNKFNRLSEHINLQISQLNYYKAQEAKLVSITHNANELESAKNAWTEAKKEMTKTMRKMITAMGKMETKIELASNKADSMGTQLVTVLGIFAAIVLAFSGGLSILGNAMVAVAEAEIVIYKLAFICLLTGLILFNIIFMLMYFVAKIIGKSIYAECKVKDCRCEEGKNDKCKAIHKVKRRLPYVFYFNTVVVVLMVADIVVWELLKNNIIH